MTLPTGPETLQGALVGVEELCCRHQITALENFLESCRVFAEDKTLNIAILGRFKAGKSSFLNHLLGRHLLPVGVIPVTSVVTEIQYGPREEAVILFRDGRTEQVGVERIGEFISESENPENSKLVGRVRVELPAMERYRGIRFVDTPGLESVLEHNTDASLEWLPRFRTLCGSSSGGTGTPPCRCSRIRSDPASSTFAWSSTRASFRRYVPKLVSSVRSFCVTRWTRCTRSAPTT
ncbi:MAG: dynamin family protein [candidate division NC10 bacterium]|nr:dynamin family protein [candidate division NC10 bacterium]